MNSERGLSSASQSAGVLAIRSFGWAMLTLLVAYLASNFLAIGSNWGTVTDFIVTGKAGKGVWIQVLLYLAAIALAIGGAVATRQRSLRADSRLVSDLNAFIVRAAFWSVLLVGIADAAISFLRVEELLPSLIGNDLTHSLGRAQFRGPYVHVPLIVIGVVLAAFTRTLGFTWLALLIVVAELTIVLTRFVFSYEQAFMGDLVRFWYAALFLFASAYTLLEEGHVRVDVFYTTFRDRTKGFVNAYGSILLGITLCWTIIFVGTSSKTAIINGPLLNFEVSQSGFGMYVKYLMAAFLGVFAITMLVQFVSYLFDSVADIRREPGKRIVETQSAH
ncbi:MAG: TRAP transporter small permease subunit [Burkholderiaceae bacterium]|nr:TRAP transporter small permease subunit [Burkholderiaceae bacterium]